ncbi:transcriptional repressor LexA [Zooshikella marina]|uniref:LexA repressor n=1 Tax=Zooshikella ganghwensis TaxID=202772 RepID=A0A4P9VMB0_9GAMM|nr:transcriptional repressor LexA [Zooshikella ganghwensis]MBU2708339.1 transcriptional repressor LexA [Zooshikella ganghwensis]RDH44016.1 transcriptional repressor LexA [Zooshikella ganghwensis]
MTKLTARQAEILQFIKEHIEATGYPPTRAEIAKQLGFRSPNAAEEHLKALARKGAIEIIPGTSRGIRLPSGDISGLPIVGNVAAGSPILAAEHIENYCAIEPGFFNPKADYFLRVKGMSMKDAGIFEGDLIAVHKTHEARNGQIIVARIASDVTVKRFHQLRNKVTLYPENDEFNPIDVDLKRDEFTIEGLCVGVIRH